jgi:AsmA protein
LKRILAGALIVVVALVALAAGALLLVDADRFRPQVQAALGEALGRDVALGKLHFSIWSGSLEANDIRIDEDPAFGKDAFVTAESLKLGVRLWPLVTRRDVQVTSLRLDDPVVSLRQDSAGHWNISSIAGGKETAGPPSANDADASHVSVDALRIRGGRITIRTASGQQRNYADLQLDAGHLRSNAAIPFTASATIAGGGTLELEGQFGPWSADNAILTPLDARLRLRNVDLAKAGLVSGENDIGGTIDSDTRITSANGELRTGGSIEARQLKLVAAGSPASRPLRIDFASTYQLSARSGSIDNTSIGSGAARLRLAGTFDHRQDRVRVDLRLGGQQLPVDDVQALLPAFGVVLPERSKLGGGVLGLDLTAKGPLDALTISGPVTLDNTLLEGFSLGSKLGTALSLAGISAPSDTLIRHADAMLVMEPAGVTVDPLNAEIVGLGRILGRGRMDADESLDFRLRVLLDDALTAGSQRNDVGGLIANLFKGSSEDGIGVRVRGTARDPKFKVDPGAILGMLGNGNAAREDGKPDDAGEKKPKRTEDLLKDLLRGALKPNKDTSGSRDQDRD